MDNTFDVPAGESGGPIALNPFAVPDFTPLSDSGVPGEVFALPDGSLSAMESVGTPETVLIVLGPGRTIDFSFDATTGELKLAATGGRLAVVPSDGLEPGLALTVLPPV